MPTLLHLDASPRGNYSVSRQLSTAAVDAWKIKNPTGTVGAFSAPDQHTDENKRALALSDELVAEVLAADEIIIGTPMYNFAIPAVLKAWIDHVVRAGKTFQYTATGVDGLASGRKVVVAVASGGVYDEASGMAAYNYEIPYLRHILGFIGISDVTFVQAGGTMAVAQGKISGEEFLAPFAKQIKEAV